MMSQALKNVRNDLIKVTVMSVVSGYLSGKNLMDQDFQLNIAYTVAGFAVYDLVVAKYVAKGNFGEHKAMVENLAKVATMLVFVRLAKSQSFEALTDEKWLTTSAITLAGFAVYHLVTKKMFNTSDRKGDWKQISDDWISFGTMMMVSHYLSGGDITDRNFLQRSTNTILGYNMGSIADYAK